jgi:hypothetical protein
MRKTKRIIRGRRKTRKQRGGNEKLISAVNKVYDTIDFSNPDVHDEFTKLSKIFDEILVPILKEHEEKAREYYEKRETYSKEIVEPVAKKAEEELKEIIKEYGKKDITYQVASSYSAKMNLIKESDVDFFLLLNPMTDEKVERLGSILKDHGFSFEKVGSPGTVNAYHIYNKIVDGVEVEFKIRDYSASEGIRGLHTVLDHKLDHTLKILITYAKSVLKASGNKDAYNKFKTIYFSVCFKDVKGAYYIKV